MSILTWFIVYFVLFILACTYLTVKAGKTIKASAAEYYVGGRSIGPFVLIATCFASLLSAFGMLGLPGFAYVHGVAEFPFILTCDALFMIFFYIVASRLWLLGKEFHYLSPNEMLGDRYSSKVLPIFAGLILVVFTIPFMAVQMIGISYLINTLLGANIPVWVNYTIVAILVFGFTVVGGQRSVAWTDALMGTIMFFTVISATIVFPYKAFGGFSEMFSLAAQKIPASLSLPGAAGKLSFIVFVSMSLAWLPFFIVQPHLTQRYLIAKSHKDLMKVGWAVAFCIFLLGLMAVVLGIGGKLLYPSLAAADKVFPTILVNHIPPALAAIIILGIISAAITTVDAQLLVLSVIWTRDVYRWVFKRGPTSEKEQILVGRLTVVGLMLITIYISTLKLPMMALLVLLSTAGVGTLAPTIFGGLFWRKSSLAGALSSALVGVVILVLLELQVFAKAPLWGIHSGVWSLAAAVLVFVIVSPLTKPVLEPADRWAAFFKTKGM